MQGVSDFFFSIFSREAALFVVSMLPIIELRGSIILGAALDMNWLLVYGICVVGSILPSPFIIVFGRQIIKLLKKIKIFRNIAEKYEKKLLKKADKVVKYELIGLMLFVAVPLPGTGVWTGSAIAALLDLRLKNALPAILLGNLIAGVAMLLLSYGTAGLIKSF